MSETVNITLDKYSDDDLLSTLLRYGLLIGAIFQLVCIAASILLPSNENCGDANTTEENTRTTGESVLNNVRRLHKLRKQDKKKRR